MHCLVFTDTDLYSLTKGKSYLAKQKWRRSTCLRDQCYDVGCHPCLTYQVRIMTLASTVFKNSTFQKKSHLNAFGSKFDLDVK